MFYHFLYPLTSEFALFNLFRYISFRGVFAFLLSALLTIWLGKHFIRYMKHKQFGQIIRDDGPQTHLKKAGTPTMGGVFIFVAIILTMLVTGNFFSFPFLICLFVFVSYFILGLIDDYYCVLNKNTKGVSARGKLIWQFLTAIVACWAIKLHGGVGTELYLPFVKDAVIDLGWFYLLFGPLVIVGSSNAVNLTDGLDGLAIGPVVTSAMTLLILAYAAGHAGIAQYLFIPHVESVGELAVFAAAIMGAGVGFLWYNSYPAQIFMGDVGSLSLGGALGTMAVVTKNEVLFVLIGGIFVAEALSVIIQVVSYKTRKKRVFKMAPLHHHFELKGWPEPKVIVRFWIISLFLAILAIATLKMR